VTLDRDRLARIIFSGLNDIEEWRLGDAALAAAKNYPRDYPAEIIDDWGMIFVDITLDDATGDLVCHEVNGPNAVGSDALTGDSELRARNEACQALRRTQELGYLGGGGRLTTPIATVHAHQHWKYFRTGGEFYPRVARFADAFAELMPDNSLACHAAGDALGGADIAVVTGDVPSVAHNISIDPQSGRFHYLGRPVVFLGNPNLLPELSRIGKLGRDERGRANMRVLHAWRLAPLFHDKATQQQLFEGTGIRPLRHFSADSKEEAATKARAMLAHGPVVLKPSDTSGGAGVTVVVPAMDDAEIEARIDTLLAECAVKYGDNCETMIFPIRGFEFVRSTGSPMEDGQHLWDLRIAVLFEPGKAQAFPVSLRFAPLPFDPDSFHRNRDQWISNVSGRRETFLKSGMDDAVLAGVGMSHELIDRAMQACVRWTIKAWDRSIRGGGKDGAVYEDTREEVDAPFYRWEKFMA
jgi:hypothetical protein